MGDASGPDAGGAADAEADQLDLKEPPENIAPLVQEDALQALQTRLQDIFAEQKEMLEKQAELREKLVAIRAACEEEETAHQTLLDEIAQDKTDLDTLVEESCAPVMELLEKTGDIREKFTTFDNAETELLRIANESTIAGEAFQRLPTVEVAGRFVTMSAEKIKEGLQEVGAQDQFSNDLQDRIAALKAQLDYQDEETKVLWEELLEKQRSLRRAAPYEASLATREKEEEVFASQQAELKEAQRLLGYVLKKAAEYAEPRESMIKSIATSGARTVDIARMQARFETVARTNQKRLLRLTWLQWHATSDGLRRLRKKHESLLENAPTESQVLIEPLQLADRLTKLEARLDAIDKTKLLQTEYQQKSKTLDADFEKSTTTRDDCIARLQKLEHANATKADLQGLFQRVSTLSQEMTKLEGGVQEEEAKLFLCASVDGVQKLIGQVISVWTAVKEADKGKADRRDLEKVNVAISAAWQECANSGVQPEALIGAVAQPTEKRIEDCKAAINSNEVHFTELEGILTGVAAFVEETVRQLQRLEHA
jgi:hypothetical protein